MGAATILTQLDAQTTPHEHDHSSVNTEIEPILLFSLLAGSAAIALLLLHIVLRSSPVEEKNEDDDNRMRKLN